MYKELDLSDFISLVEILEEDSDCELTYWVDKGRLFIRGEVDTELMLRISNKSVVISRIFVTKRGNGTRVLNWLKEYARKEGINYIDIEQAITEDMFRFADKHGFELTEAFGEFKNYRLTLN